MAECGWNREITRERGVGELFRGKGGFRRCGERAGGIERGEHGGGEDAMRTLSGGEGGESKARDQNGGGGGRVGVTQSGTKKRGFLEGGFCKMYASLGCGALSAKCTAGANILGYFLLPWP